MNKRFEKSNFPWRFFKKIGLLQLFILVITVLLGSSITRIYLKEYIIDQSVGQLKEDLDILSYSFDQHNLDPISWCKSFKNRGSSRFTLVASSGKVECDNFVDITKMDNHQDRPEIKTASVKGYGHNIRFSETLNIQMLYMAKKIKSKDTTLYFRQAIPLKKLQSAVSFIDKVLLIILIPVILISFIMLFWGSLKVSVPLLSILEKVSEIEREMNDPNPSIPEEDEWLRVENALDKASIQISNFINKLKFENRKINTLLYSMNDPVIALDKNQSILFSNLSFREAYDVEESTEISGKKAWETIQDHDLLERFNKVSETEKVSSLSSYAIKEKVYDIFISPLKDENKKTYGVVSIFHDITERYNSDKMRADFVSNVSHELKTPLTSLVGFSSLLKENIEKLNNPELTKYSERIEQNAKRLTTLFQDILTLSYIENANRLDKSDIDTKESSEYVIANLKQSYRNENPKFSIKDEEKKVLAEPRLLEQIQTNLIENAIKYSNGNKEIDIIWKKDGQYTQLLVKNSGSPIDKIHHSRLFERFYRVDESRSRELGGSGLGLSIVKHITQKHGGKLGHFYDEETKKNCFFVNFPQA